MNLMAVKPYVRICVMIDDRLMCHSVAGYWAQCREAHLPAGRLNLFDKQTAQVFVDYE